MMWRIRLGVCALAILGMMLWCLAGPLASQAMAEGAGGAVERKLITSFHMVYAKESETSFNYRTEEWVTATYDDQGRITHKEFTGDYSEGYESANGRGYTLDYEYDRSGNLLRITGTEGDPAQPSASVSWYVGFEKGGLVMRASGTENSGHRSVSDYHDKDGKLVSREYLIRTGAVDGNGRLSFTYDDQGRLIGQSAEVGNNDDWSHLTTYEITVDYDKNSRLSSMETCDADGGLWSKRTYKYDDAGRMTGREFRNVRSGSDETISQTYSYSKKGRLKSGKQKGSTGNWADATASFKTDKDGSIVSARIEGEDFVRTYEIEYAEVEGVAGKEPVNALDLTDPFNPELYNELWVSHSNMDPTPFDEAECLKTHREWLELHGGASGQGGSKQASDKTNPASTYDPIISAYRKALGGEAQPSDEVVNSLVWDMRDRLQGKLSYAFCDLNADGAAELLVGVEEDTPTAEEGLSVSYRLYDLFTAVGGKPTRVLGDDAMASLGYRAFCVPCEDGVVATGGTGGAAYHIRECWQMGDKANELALICRVTMSGDSYEFADGSGSSQTLTGEEAKDKYASITAQYTPIASFDWQTL